MKFAIAHPHPFLQVLFTVFVLTLIAFAMEGCPTLAKEKYCGNHKTTTQIPYSQFVADF
jgi:hypothetical protein